ncbi:MAG: restriction endonuclease subunit S [Candidatus Promineifilaceae bacterium]|nr:restriction endonuclease subunit S [Candidatus Promineifilaceae bacterium]
MWHTKQLGKVVNQITVGHVGPMANRYVESGIPFLRSLNIKPYRISTIDLKYISPQFDAELSKSRLTPGDVVVVRTGNTGTAAVIPKWLTHSNCSDLVIIRTGDEVDPRFLAYYLNSAVGKHHINSRNVGSVQAHFNIGAARKLPIKLPPIQEQKAIAAVLGAFDDKIELNRQMNATLEEMARAIFKSWFVDFDPVRAKARGEQPYGMDAETAALFPDRFEVVDGREVPEGWRVVRIKDIASLLRDSVRPNDSPDKEFEHHSIPAFDNGKMPALELGGSIRSNKYNVPSESVLLSKLNPRVPRVWLPDPRFSSRSICSTEFLVLVPCPGIGREYLYALFTSRTFQRRFSTLVTGTSSSHQRVKPNHLLDMEVVIPSTDIHNRSVDLMSSFYFKILRNRYESQTLAKLRDTLLPRLMSGQLRVFDIGALAE